ncbi:MAG: glycosyltransferase [Ardenticatenales bacterium]|nr:glycosyltransferase [Ardenticatenales bacterium]
MRWVLIGPVWPYRGGIAQHTALLARTLAGAGHEVTTLTFRSLYPAWLFPGRTVIDPSQQPVRVQAERIIAPLWPIGWPAVARRVRAARPDAVLLVWWVPFFAPFVVGFSALLGRRGRRPPIVLICHNVLPHDAHGVRGRVAGWLTALALRRGDRWLVHATPLVAVLEGVVGERARMPGAVARAALPLHHLATVGGDGVTPHDSAHDDTVTGDAAGPDGVGPRPIGPAPTLLFFGLVRPYKGLDVLIDALAIARETVPGVRLVVAGEFWQRVDAFRAQADRLGLGDAVTLRDGYVQNEEVAPLFASADAVVLPYRAATSSGVLTLAIEHGVPMIVTDVGGLPEVVVDGEAGLVVPPGDARALAAAVVRLCRERGLATRLRAGSVAARGRIGWAAYVAALVGLVGGAGVDDGAAGDGDAAAVDRAPAHGTAR